MKYLKLSVLFMVISVAHAAFGDCGCGCGKKDGPVVVGEEDVIVTVPGSLSMDSRD